MTDYYPQWLDNLADDVVLQAAVLNGEVHGADKVKSLLTYARGLYTFQEFRFYGMRGDLWLEDYRSTIADTEHLRPGGIEIYNLAVVYFNNDGKATQLVMNHRPRSALLTFSSKLAKQFGGTYGPNLFFDGDVNDRVLDHDLSRVNWPS